MDSVLFEILHKRFGLIQISTNEIWNERSRSMQRYL